MESEKRDMGESESTVSENADSSAAGPGAGLSRRSFLTKAAMYGPPVVLGGRLLLQAGVAAASSSESSSGTSSESSTSSTGAPPPTITPLDALLNDLAVLKAIPLSGRPDRDGRIEDAIASLTEATTAAWWTDGGYDVLPQYGQGFFAALRAVIDDLRTINAPTAAITGVLADVVTQAGAVANYALVNGTAVATDVSQAAAEAAAGDYDGAVDTYMDLWRWSTIPFNDARGNWNADPWSRQH